MEQCKHGNFHIFVISNSQSFIPQTLKAVGPLGGKISSFFSHLGFEIQTNNDYQTSRFKLRSFRTFQRYLTYKNPTHGQGTVSVFQFSASSF